MCVGFPNRRQAILLSTCFFIFVGVLSGCTGPISGPVSVSLLQPTGQHCQYQSGKVTLYTLNSLYDMSGKVGQVVTLDKSMSVSIDTLNPNLPFSKVPLDFYKSGDTYIPADYTTFSVALIYYYLESAYRMFANADPNRGDLANYVPNLSNTPILFQARYTSNQTDSTDNAHFVAIPLGNSISNFFLFDPFGKVTQVPVNLNPGVVGHEFTHFLAYYLYKSAFYSSNNSDASYNSVKAFDEGTADYFGFYLTKDPGWFTCSFPGKVERDLGVPKTFTSQMFSDIQSSSSSQFYPYDAGGAWASIQLAIGNRVGHDVNARALIALMANFAQCPGFGSVDFRAIASCHQSILGRPDVAQIYSAGGLF